MEGRLMNILVTGATGYVGGRLVPVLLRDGHSVRCLVRDARRLSGFSWARDVEIVEGDVLEPETLALAIHGIDVAFYLIHSMAGGREFSERDKAAARNFGRAAVQAQIRRIIYLGGLEPRGAKRSTHLSSRIETGDILRECGIPVTEFRAGVIVGSGSLSFEIVRYLTERVPVMIRPRWVRTPTQPIAIRDVLEYLRQALHVPESAGRIIEIGGSEVLTYADMFDIYARVRGLRRIALDVPVLTPRLSSLWVGLFTPVSLKIARPLIEGLDNEVTVRDDTAARLFTVRPISYEAAVRLALQRFETGTQETAWHSAVSSTAGRRGEMAESMTDAEGLIQERRQVSVARSQDEVYDFVQRLGGENGWLYANALWSLRGLIDSLLGGVGLRRGRRGRFDVRVGDVVDWWRVEAAERPSLLRLRAEMKVPGRAWLQFDIRPDPDLPGHSLVTQTAFFEPRGLSGLLYWYALQPAHGIIFRGMARTLKRQLEAPPTLLSPPA